MTSPCVASSMDLPLTSRISSPTSRSALSAGEPATKNGIFIKAEIAWLPKGRLYEWAMKKGCACQHQPTTRELSHSVIKYSTIFILPILSCPSSCSSMPSTLPTRTYIRTIEFNFLIFRFDQDDDIATQVHHAFVSLLHLGDSKSSSSGLSVPAVMVRSAQHTKTRALHVGNNSGCTREQFVARASPPGHISSYSPAVNTWEGWLLPSHRRPEKNWVRRGRNGRSSRSQWCRKEIKDLVLREDGSDRIWCCEKALNFPTASHTHNPSPKRLPNAFSQPEKCSTTRLIVVICISNYHQLQHISPSEFIKRQSNIWRRGKNQHEQEPSNDSINGKRTKTENERWSVSPPCHKTLNAHPRSSLSPLRYPSPTLTCFQGDSFQSVEYNLFVCWRSSNCKSARPWSLLRLRIDPQHLTSLFHCFQKQQKSQQQRLCQLKACKPHFTLTFNKLVTILLNRYLYPGSKCLSARLLFPQLPTLITPMREKNHVINIAINHNSLNNTQTVGNSSTAT